MENKTPTGQTSLAENVKLFNTEQKCQLVLNRLHVRPVSAETRQWIVLSVVWDTVAEHLIDNLLKFLDHLNT